MPATIEWTLHHEDASICCTARETPSGVELSVSCEGLPLARRIAATVVDAEAQANEIRAAWEAVGWARQARG